MGETETSTESEEILDSGRWSVGNWAVIGLFFVLTIVGIAMAAGAGGRELLTATVGPGGPGVIIPVAVFLYSGLGALGYVFTKLMTSLDDYDKWSDFENLAEMLMRIPAAWLLAVGVYQFGSLALGSTELASSQLATGIPFLVGLYVNVAFKWLGSLADRLLGQQVERTGWVDSNSGPSGGQTTADRGPGERSPDSQGPSGDD
ncbi:hypothetical protein BDK61_0149 [Haloarcula quadrata]|jgi:hypothetical protein|uniref:Uncharacterized protein n=1 Tax=Haloarcula quadrata TaxID=182779 RepID=A0A495R137_9EURY|nr:hypothetical protein [Haloarcula quadrata]RKS80890.1 hypothetical protein BDK61_0149 [Haloarcula quadrata]